METMNAKRTEINAADVEHIAALTAGALLLITGLRKGGAAGLLFKLAGAGLVFRGQQGYRRLYDLLGLELPMNGTGAGLHHTRVEAAVVIDRSPEELYRIWRNLENLPIFMNHLIAVYEIDDVYSRWVAKAPLGMVVKWDARIVNDIENEIIAWESLEGSGVDNAGSVHFEPTADGQTKVRVVLRYDPPANQLGTAVAKMFGQDAQHQIDRDLQRFKEIMEAGPRAVPVIRPQAEMM
jgi:uncharacterized membrane protein